MSKPLFNEKRMPLYRLKKERLARNMTQKWIASKLGITVQYYSQIERGINTLTYRHALLIAELFDMTTDELFKEVFLYYEGKRIEDKLRRENAYYFRKTFDEHTQKTDQ